MGHSKAEKIESHERILRVAAARFREAGLEAVGVAELMQDAGLTHGGFYRHFESREDLLAKGVEAALRDGGKGVRLIETALDEATTAGGALSARKRELLFALIDWYVSISHRDDLATSCAVTSLAGDIARSNDRARLAYTRQVGVYLALLTRLVSSDKKNANRKQAIAALATLVGAVSMARAVNDEKLSREILRCAADELKSHLGQT